MVSILLYSFKNETGENIKQAEFHYLNAATGNQPTNTTIFKLANALDITPSQLIEKVEVQVKQ